VAELKAEKLMVIPSTPNEFRTKGSTMRSLDVGRV